MIKTAFRTFPKLYTTQLTLRQLSETDEKCFEEIAYYGTYENSTKTVKTIIGEINERYLAESAICWGIFKAEELIGTCGYYRGFADNIGEVGYIMRKAYRGKGLMSDAVKSVINFGFDGMGLSLITAYTKDDNQASRGLLKTLGFKATHQMSGKYRRFELKKAYKTWQ